MEVGIQDSPMEMAMVDTAPIKVVAVTQTTLMADIEMVGHILTIANQYGEEMIDQIPDCPLDPHQLIILEIGRVVRMARDLIVPTGIGIESETAIVNVHSREVGEVVSAELAEVTWIRIYPATVLIAPGMTVQGMIADDETTATTVVTTGIETGLTAMIAVAVGGLAVEVEAQSGIVIEIVSEKGIQWIWTGIEIFIADDGDVQISIRDEYNGI